MLLSPLYQQIFANSPNSAYILSPSADPIILDVNEAFLRDAGRDRAQLIGRPLFEAFAPDPDDRQDTGVEALRAALARLIETGQPQALPTQRYPVRTSGPGGEERYVERFWDAVNTPVFGDDGELLCIHHVTIDVTEQKRAEAALREADRRKDEFLAMLAHELRNPLAPILAASNLLGHGVLDNERARQASCIISRQVRHMTGLVDDLLDVSRVTRGLIALEKNRLDVGRIVSDAVEQVLPLVQSRRHVLSVVHTHTEPLTVCGDSKRLVQVIANLLNNAAKYTPEGGSILLDTAVEEGVVKIRVSDNGIGMTAEMVKRSFELFAQAERGADRAQGGLGIGLALVRSLVELHGGTVTAQSGVGGQGSRFTVTLPRTGPCADQLADADATPAGADEKRLQVLVVDDNEDAASMLALMLRGLGNEVAVENDPFTALQTARRLRPDVCILDIGLPEMDGNELARRLRADPATAESTLIAVTGYGQAEDRKRAIAAGFDRHFVKPVSGSDLVAVLHEAALGQGRVSSVPQAARA
jgi:PAS domain S-box-containing protein